MLQPGEKSAIKLVLRIADRYGYGNMIAHLKRGWALSLMKSNPDLTYNQALLATDATAYPKHWSPEYLAAQDEAKGEKESHDG